MKKRISIIFILMLAVIFIPWHSVSAKTIKTLETSMTGDRINVGGIAEEGTLAVQIIVYDEEEKNIVAMQSTHVDDNSTYHDRIYLKSGNYLVKVADYDGGEYISKAVAPSTDGTEEYTIDCEDSILTFEDDAGYDFSASVVDVMKLTEKEREELGIHTDEYEEAKEKIENNTKKYGILVGVYVINIYDDQYEYTDEGTIKIKMTDELKQYNTFKLVNIDEEDFSTKDVVELTIDGDYLVGKLPHFSVYALVADKIEENNNETEITEPTETEKEKTTTPEKTKTPEEKSDNPKTGDNVIVYIALLVIASLGLIAVYTIRKKNTTKSKH